MKLPSIPFKLYNDKSPKVPIHRDLVPALVGFDDGTSELVGYVPKGTSPDAVPLYFNIIAGRKPVEIMVCNALEDIVRLWG